MSMKAYITLIISFLILPIFFVQAQTKMETEIASQLMCPCPDCVHLLEPCDCGVATGIKKEIGQWLQEGKTKEEIFNIMVERYGEKVLATPRTPLAWIIPFAGIALGIAIVAYVLIKLLRTPRPKLKTAQTIDVERYKDQIEREIEGYRKEG